MFEELLPITIGNKELLLFLVTHYAGFSHCGFGLLVMVTYAYVVKFMKISTDMHPFAVILHHITHPVKTT